MDWSLEATPICNENHNAGITNSAISANNANGADGAYNANNANIANYANNANRQYTLYTRVHFSSLVMSLQST